MERRNNYTNTQKNTKKGVTSICDNNRGIALLSVVGKLFTRILAKRTQLFAEEFLTETQFGFIQDRSTIDAIFVARQITEKCIEKQESVHWLFLDLKKAFDSVNREAAWKLFKKIGMPEGFVKLLRGLHDDMEARVRVGSNLSEPFNINNGLRQGCVFAPYGFLIWMHHAILTRQQALPGCGIPIRYKLNGRLNNNRIKRWNVTKVGELLFADDEGQPHSTAKQCAEASQMTASNMRKWCLQTNAQKTKVLHCIPGKCNDLHSLSVCKANGQDLEEVKSFTYLGSILANDGSITEDINGRIAKAAYAFGRLKRAVWNSSDISVQTKCKVYKSVVLGTLLYSAETWTTLQHHVKKLQSFNIRCIRRFLGVKWWMRKSNLDVRRKAGLPHKMEQVIQFKRLCWLGHVERMKDTSLPKILLHGEIEYGKRPQHKPKKRWKDCVLNDLCDFGIEEKGLNDKVWAEKCKDRREWR